MGVGRLVVAAVVITAVSTSVGGPVAGQVPPADGPVAGPGSSIAELRRDVGPGGEVSIHDETGLVRFVSAPAGAPIDPGLGSGPSAVAPTPEAAAEGFVARYGAAFGAESVDDLVVSEVVEAPEGGRTTIRFTEQTAEGVPVLAGGLAVQLDDDLAVVAAAGELLPAGSFATEPTVAATDAAATAAEAVAKAQGIEPADVAGITTSEPTLVVFNPALLGGPGLRINRLVWSLQVQGTGPDGPFDELVLVDATTGGVALHFDGLAHGRDRRTCDDSNVVTGTPNCSTAGPVVRTEAGPAHAVAEVNNAHTFAGHTYDYFFSRFGRDSLDGAGMTLYSEVRYCPSAEECPYANAFWNGSQMTYGDGFASADDVVGHELGHGLTDFTSGLFYYYQSGAINESLSDVFGELIDLVNGAGTDTAAVRWLLGEDLPGGAIRNMADPPAGGDPDRMTSPIYHVAAWDNGGVHINSGVNNKAAVLLADGGTFNGRTVTALGIEKVARIYYEVETALLQSGSDYTDLFDMLPQACTNLVGTAGITAANCVEVVDAVTATEMHLEPPAIAHPDAPECAGGASQADLFFDPIPSGAPGWTTSTVSGGPWSTISGYATSDPLTLYHADTPDVADASVVRTALAVPTGVETYLTFEHAHEFEGGGYDGGAVEYDVVGGATTWVDAGSLLDHGDYNGTVNGTGNPLNGRPGFVGLSHGFGQSRLDLTSLAGQSIVLRFRFGADTSVGAFGWFIDDVHAFTCTAGPGATSVPPPDFDANGRTDLSVFRASTGRWYVHGVAGSVLHGVAGDVPVPGQYDADPATDVAVFRPSSGRWYIQGVAGSTLFGVTGDVPVPGNYDADAATELAVFRPSTGRWYIQGVAGSTAFGVSGDVPVPGNYDADAATELAVFRPSTGRWYIQGVSGSVSFGVAGDLPVPGQYDADPEVDLAIFRPATGRWYVQGVSGSVLLGLGGDVPLPLPWAVYQSLVG